MHLIADITWRPAIGDSNPLAWCITGAHLIACWLCFLAGRKQRTDMAASKIWFVLAGLMLALCINKQLDLQTLLTQFGREVAKRGGWYNQRRTFQTIFVVAVTAISMSCLVAMWFVMRGRWRNSGLAFVGVVLLITFVVIRAASFHHVDRLLYGLPLIGNWMNAGLELGGAFLVAAEAARELTRVGGK